MNHDVLFLDESSAFDLLSCNVRFATFKSTEDSVFPGRYFLTAFFAPKMHDDDLINIRTLCDLKASILIFDYVLKIIAKHLIFH